VLFRSPPSKNNNPNDKHANSITVTHFTDNSPNKLIIDRLKDQDGRPSNSIIVIISPAGRDYVAYPFKPDEMEVFMAMVKHCAFDLPYHCTLFTSIIRAYNGASASLKNRENKGGGNNNNQSYDNNSYNNTPQHNYQQTHSAPPQQTYTTPPAPQPDNTSNNYQAAPQSDDNDEITFNF
jgi:hypothetical protein